MIKTSLYMVWAIVEAAQDQKRDPNRKRVYDKMKEWGIVIRKLEKEKEIDRIELARLTGLSIDFLNAMAIGVLPPEEVGEAEIFPIADAFGVNRIWLMSFRPYPSDY